MEYCLQADSHMAGSGEREVLTRLRRVDDARIAIGANPSRVSTWRPTNPQHRLFWWLPRGEGATLSISSNQQENKQCKQPAERRKWI